MFSERTRERRRVGVVAIEQGPVDVDENAFEGGGCHAVRGSKKAAEVVDHLEIDRSQTAGSSCPSRQNANRVTPNCPAPSINSSSRAASVSHMAELALLLRPRIVLEAESRLSTMASRCALRIPVA